ncbi:MAG: phage integrase family protein [Thermoflexales bacterium]|nr:phage integrase family protein [Thermoflexales bacterium]
MTRSQGKLPYQTKNTRPLHPDLTPIGEWPIPNRGFYVAFQQWLRQTGSSEFTINLYRVVARLALGLLNKPYWTIDPDADFERVQAFIVARALSPQTRADYHKGLLKFEQYWRYRCRRPRAEKALNWSTFIGALPDDMARDIQAYLIHRRRAWLPEQQRRASLDLVSQVTRPLRWLAAQHRLDSWEAVTPKAWDDYVDVRLAAGLKPVSLNGELRAVQPLLIFLAEQGRPICQRMLRVEMLDEATRLPRDAPLDQLRQLLKCVEENAQTTHRGVRRTALMDRAWILLMLHSGLRAGEVRRLRLGDIDWERRQVRIEQSKGLKDRLVCLSAATLEALKAYLAVRGPAETLPDYVFIYRHGPLSVTYCGQRLLKYYGKRSGFHITPHQLRHSCATLLLNAGAPILTVQTILGHQHIDTTLGYARLYDGTVAADYYRTMAQVERQMALPEDAHAEPPSSGQLLALVDSLRSGTLNESQRETVRALRAGITALAERGSAPLDSDRPIA